MADSREDKPNETRCQQILRAARTHAHLHKVEADDVEDCAMSFLASKLMSQNAGDLSATEEEPLEKQADSWARHWVGRRRSRRHKEASLCGPDGSEESGPAAHLASREPGPEELLQEADLMERLLNALLVLTPGQQQLFVRHYLDRARVVDLREETGRSASSLGKGLHFIRKRMKKVLEGDGMDASEVADYQNLLDGFRKSH